MVLAPVMELPVMRDVIAKAKSAFHAAVRSMTGTCLLVMAAVAQVAMRAAPVMNMTL